MPDGVKTLMVALSGIAIPADRMRSLRSDVVTQLADSIRVQGLLHPVLLRPRSRGGIGYILVAGRHRLEAVRSLKLESIRAEIREGLESDAAELAEIDENLIRADLSPAEIAAHQAARKGIYERIHPETRKGAGPQRGKGTRGGRLKSQNEILAYVDDAARHTGRSRATVSREAHRGENIPDVASLAGTSLDKGDELDALAKLPAREQERVMARAIAGERVSAKAEVKKVNRAQREVELATKITALPDARFGVIVADPEWQFEPWSRETGMDRAADNHYPTSVLEVIKSRPVESIAADDCVLFLWATNPMLPHALLVMAAWGFDYVSNYAWGKDKAGTGYWNREKHELLLIGTRGNIPCPAPGAQWHSLIMAPRGEHSEKPEVFLEMIEEYFPNLPKIELNRRGPARPGWSGWGMEFEENEAAE